MRLEIGDNHLILYQILIADIVRIVWQTVSRIIITNKTWEWKG